MVVGLRSPREVTPLTNRVMGDVVVIVELVGHVGHAGMHHRIHVVKPPVEPTIRAPQFGVLPKSAG